MNDKKLFTSLKLGEDYDNLILFDNNEVLDIIFEKNSNIEFNYVDKRNYKLQLNSSFKKFDFNIYVFLIMSLSLVFIFSILLMMFLESNNNQESPAIITNHDLVLKQKFGLDLLLEEIKIGAKK